MKLPARLDMESLNKRTRRTCCCINTRLKFIVLSVAAGITFSLLLFFYIPRIPLMVTENFYISPKDVATIMLRNSPINASESNPFFIDLPILANVSVTSENWFTLHFNKLNYLGRMYLLDGTLDQKNYGDGVIHDLIIQARSHRIVQLQNVAHLKITKRFDRFIDDPSIQTILQRYILNNDPATSFLEFDYEVRLNLI